MPVITTSAATIRARRTVRSAIPRGNGPLTCAVDPSRATSHGLDVAGGLSSADS